MLQNYSPLVQTLMGTCFTWAFTALGASLCIFQSPHSRPWLQNLLLDVSLGFSVGVMLSASFWSLLEPALAIAKADFEMGSLSCVPAVLGLLLGVAFLCVSDLLLPVKWLEPVKRKEKVEHSPDCQPTVVVPQPLADVYDRHRRSQVSATTPLAEQQQPTHSSPVTDASTMRLVMTRRLWLLIIAVTVHNIPEGLAVGVAFGGVGQNTKSTFENARNLVVQIGFQNFPEGLAVSLPLRASGYSWARSFWYGQLSGLVEPVAGVFGCIAIQTFTRLQPYALGFAAGAMIFVVLDDLVPEAHSRGNGRLSSIAAIIGFITMMVLEVIPVNA